MNEDCNNVVSLKELVLELFNKYRIPSKIDKSEMKRIRTKLRSNKGKRLQDMSLDHHKGELWKWPIELKDEIELELMALISN